jgi:hypothetical protein
MKQDLGKETKTEEASNNDFEKLKEHQAEKNKTITLDQYIEFVTEVNRLAGHPPKKPAPITGDRFLI